MSTNKNYTWDGQFNINLLFRSNGLAFVSYNPTDGQITIVNIPDQTFLDAAHGFGKWQIRSIFDLGENQKDLGGDKLLKDSLEDFFAFPMDGFVDFKDKYKDKNAKELVELLRGNPLTIFGIFSEIKTDLTLLELIRLKMGFAKVRFDKITEIDLSDYLEKDRLLDGTEVLVADSNKLDVALSELADPIIKKEHKNVVIFNGTDKPFFAQKWARLVTNIGGDVIITTNATTKVNKTLVSGESSKTLTRLSQIFRSCRDCDKIIKSDEDFATSRGQITIKLAPDLN